MFISPSTGAEPESSGEHVSSVTTTSSRASLSECDRPRVVFYRSTQGGGGGGGCEVTWRVSDWSTSVGC